jgi:hypothetical protein
VPTGLHEKSLHVEAPRLRLLVIRAKAVIVALAARMNLLNVKEDDYDDHNPRRLLSTYLTSLKFLK